MPIRELRSEYLQYANWSGKIFRQMNEGGAGCGEISELIV